MPHAHQSYQQRRLRLRTLTHGPLHVAHNQAVLVVQELDAHLRHLWAWAETEQGPR